MLASAYQSVPIHPGGRRAPCFTHAPPHLAAEVLFIPVYHVITPRPAWHCLTALRDNSYYVPALRADKRPEGCIFNQDTLKHRTQSIGDTYTHLNGS